MKSRTSLFNKGLSKNLFKRFWPVWAGYLLVLIFVLPVHVFGSLENVNYYANELYPAERYVLSSADSVIYISFFAAVIVAMAMFGDLYKSRNCGMISALPIKRESIFVTAYLTGLLPMIASDVLIGIICMIMGLAQIKYLLIWIAVAVMTNIAFFGAASLCAMLTGSIVILPMVYIVLNLTPVVVQQCIQGCLEKFVYGFSSTYMDIWGMLSPLTAMGSGFFSTIDHAGNIIFEGMGVIAAYCALGIALAAAALFILKKRHMETNGDVVAVKCLKPIFKYCMSFGTALVLANVVSSMLPRSLFTGFAAALIILILMLIGAAVGYYAAEMMMQKTFRVFDGKWKGLLIVWAVYAVLVIGYETDLFGYERMIPETEDIESVMIRGIKADTPENIEKIRELHRRAIEDKDNNANIREYELLYFVYNMNNGRTISRQYCIERSQETVNDPNSTVNMVYDFMSIPENILKSELPDFPVIPENIRYCQIYSENGSSYDAGRYEDEYMILTPEEACRFYEECILPDIKDGNLGRYYPAYSEKRLDEETNIHIQLDMAEAQIGPNGIDRETKWGGVYMTVSFNAERCMKWLEENTELEIMSQRELTRLIDAGAEPAAAYTQLG